MKPRPQDFAKAVAAEFRQVHPICSDAALDSLYDECEDRWIKNKDKTMARVCAVIRSLRREIEQYEHTWDRVKEVAMRRDRLHAQLILQAGVAALTHAQGEPHV